MPSCGNVAAEGTTTLTGSSLSGAVVSLAVNALSGTFHSGDPVVITSGSHTQTFIASAQANPGATSISVTSQVANFAYPSGSAISGPTFTPVGNLCSGLKLSIVETDSSFDHSLSNPASGCAYGTGSAPAGLGCVLGSGTALSSVPNSLTALNLTAAGGTGNTGTNLSASGSRYFLIAVKQPSASLDNTFQNRAASFDLLWHIDQA
jgi:hypothetical protein